MAWHAKYWDCTSFADWLRGTKKPAAASSKGWREWETEARNAHPVRFWLTEEGLSRLQDAVFYIPGKINDFRFYIRNRWITKSHALTSTLKRGEWHDLSERILQCNFAELVNFVEVEKASRNWDWFKSNNKKRKTPNAEAGLDYLNWEVTLKYNSGMGIKKGHELYGKLTDQALAAKEILALYNWWTKVRPARPDVYDVTGWSDYCKNTKGNLFDSVEDRSPADRKKSRRILDKVSKMEKKFEQEDEEMLIRLVKIRTRLWT